MPSESEGVDLLGGLGSDSMIDTGVFLPGSIVANHIHWVCEYIGIHIYVNILITYMIICIYEYIFIYVHIRRSVRFVVRTFFGFLISSKRGLRFKDDLC